MSYYVLEVFTSKEEETIKRIKNELDLSFDSYDFFVPKIKRIYKKEGISHEKIETLFPGYIFIESNDKSMSILKKNLYQVKTLTRLLGTDKTHKDFIAPLTLDEEYMLNVLLGKDNKKRIVDISHIYLTEGKEIIVVDGPLKGLEGKIVKTNLHKRKVTVELNFMNTITTTDLGIDFIEEKETAW